MYVDFISLHIMIRIIVIGEFLRKNNDDKYEQFVHDKKYANPFMFEVFALHGSSIVFNGILIILGFALPKGQWSQNYLNGYIAMGFFGIFATVISFIVYNQRVNKIRPDISPTTTTPGSA
jgi:hypothetical protein